MAAALLENPRFSTINSHLAILERFSVGVYIIIIMAEIEIRRATAADKYDILNIADVYAGTDYLAALFEDCFINCRHTTPYVAVHKGEIIGFTAALVVDDGHTVISRAARVQPTFSGQGVYKALSQHAIMTSSADVNAFTTTDGSKAVSSSSFKRANKLILSKPYVRYNIRDTTCLIAACPSQVDSLTPVTKDVLGNFFTSKAQRQYLFPGERILINWVPFRLLLSNIPILWMREDHSLRLSDVKEEAGCAKGLLSISSTFTGPTGLYVYHVDMYGTDTNSVNRHIAAHLDFLRERVTGNAAFIVIRDPELDFSIFQSVIESFGLTERQKSPFSSLCLFEHVINRDMATAK